MTKAEEQPGLWKQTEYLGVSPHVLCTGLTARSGLMALLKTTKLLLSK